MSTVYEESVRRLNLMIAVIALRASYSGLSSETAQRMLYEYSTILRKLKIEHTYVGDDNAAYHNYLNSEFVMGTNLLDLDYDPALGPSSISQAEAAQLETEYDRILASIKESQSGEIC